MEWQDEAIVLAARSHGETNAVVEVFSRAHGRHMGLVRGGRSRRQRPILQMGNIVRASWRARLAEHLGSFQFELISAKAGLVLDDPAALAGLNTLASHARLMAEREAHEGLYEAALVILEHIEDLDIWPSLLVRWELALLEELGFGLDLSSCAATGGTQELVYVSPKSSRAVSRAAGEPYHDKLLPLPAFLGGGAVEAPDTEELAKGFALTGHFLECHVFGPRGTMLPESRHQVLNLLERKRLAASKDCP